MEDQSEVLAQRGELYLLDGVEGIRAVLGPPFDHPVHHIVLVENLVVPQRLLDIPEEYIVHSHKLIIKQISLGPEAKSGEFNVVQVSPAKGDYLEPPAVVNHRTENFLAYHCMYTSLTVMADEVNLC